MKVIPPPLPRALVAISHWLEPRLVQYWSVYCREDEELKESWISPGRGTWMFKVVGQLAGVQVQVHVAAQVTWPQLVGK